MSIGPANSMRLFGSPRVIDGKGQVIRVRSRKSIALLGFLALTHPQIHSRERLAGLFWPELNDKDARNNLRVSLARITKSLGPTVAPVLLADRLTAAFNPVPSLHCDVLEFQALQRTIAKHSLEDQRTCRQCRAALEVAADAYTGDFMHGFHLDDCEEFGEWQDGMREHLSVVATATLSALGQSSEYTGDLAAAEHFTRRLLTLDVYREEAHRRLMTVLARRGDRHAAMPHFATIKTRLHEELGVAPDKLTRAVYCAIENGELKADSGIKAKTTVSLAGSGAPHNLPIEKSTYIGNHSSLEQLVSHLKERRLVTLTGIGGVGKTRLAVQAGRNLLPPEAGAHPKQGRSLHVR